MANPTAGTAPASGAGFLGNNPVSRYIKVQWDVGRRNVQRIFSDPLNNKLNIALFLGGTFLGVYGSYKALETSLDIFVQLVKCTIISSLSGTALVGCHDLISMAFSDKETLEEKFNDTWTRQGYDFSCRTYGAAVAAYDNWNSQPPAASQ